MNVYVLMKPLAESKSRLAQALGEGQRRLLSLAMLQRVLAAALELGAAHTAVVGGDADVRALCRAMGIRWQQEPERGLNAALSALLRAAAPGGSVAYLPADLPLLRAHDLLKLQALTGPDRLVLAPDRHEQGTNALVLPPGTGFQPSFGQGSFERHLAQARELGLEAAVCRAPGLTLDVDDEADLAALLSAEPDFWATSRARLDALELALLAPDTPANAPLS